MKKEFSARPEALAKEMLIGGVVSWYDFVTAIPEPLLVVTGWKKNGKENASLQSWVSFAGYGANEYICIMAKVSKRGHLYKSLKKTGVCVLNFPSHDVLDRCMKTIGNNQYEADEITVTGLTAEKATRVNAPRIKECFLNIECEFLWARSLCRGSGLMTVAVKAVNICMDSDRYDHNKLGRYGKTGYQYYHHGPFNPETEEMAQWDGKEMLTFEPIGSIPCVTK